MLAALSIRQPWTELILLGRKTIEVRSWATRHRGELLLHAGKKVDENALCRFQIPPESFVFGALVGRCELYDCIEFTANTWATWEIHHLNKGPLDGRRYAWLLRNPKRINPLPFKARLGLMRVENSQMESYD